MRGTYRMRQIGSRLRDTAQAMPKIARLARWPDPSPTAEPRKPRYRRLLDLGYISLRWGEVSSAYYSQGVDRAGRRVRRDYMPYPVFRDLRDSRNCCRDSGQPFDYVCLLRDKQLFERYFGAAGLPVIPTVCELSPERGLEFGGRGERSFAELAAEYGTPLSLFCKPRFGIHGSDAFRLDVADGGIWVDGEPASADAVIELIREPCLAQRRIVQHDELARPHPASVNTLRLVTYRAGAGAEVLFASLKLGANGAVTDNGGNARCVVRIDADTGRYYESGYWKGPDDAYEETTEHRQTGVCFRDCSVPYYAQCLDLARRAHDWLPGVHSVGWDLAVTPDGPLLLEGNDDWSGSTSMNYADVRRRFLQIHGLRAADT